jgi:hypothetical protein
MTLPAPLTVSQRPVKNQLVISDDVRFFLGSENLFRHGNAGTECRQSVRTNHPDLYAFRKIEGLDMLNNFLLGLQEHYYTEVPGNGIGKLEGLFFVDVKDDIFFPLENHKDEESKKEDNAGKKYPENFFAEALNVKLPFYE